MRRRRTGSRLTRDSPNRVCTHSQENEGMIIGMDDVLNHQGGDEEWMASLLDWVEGGEEKSASSPFTNASSSSFD